MPKVQGLTSYLNQRESEWERKVRTLAGVRRRQLQGFVSDTYKPKNNEGYVARVDEFIVELTRLGDKDAKALLSRIDGFMDRRRGRKSYAVEKQVEHEKGILNSYQEYCKLRDEGVSSKEIGGQYSVANPRVWCAWGMQYSLRQKKKK